MVKRGPKPKATILRLVEGTHRDDRHGDATEAQTRVTDAATNFGPLAMPAKMSAGARRAWRTYIAPATWLDRSREPAAVALCELWAEFVTHPRTFTAARHGQLRAYLAMLGLTDERYRAAPQKAKRDEFFDDE